MENSNRWMAISAILGFSFFLIANLTSLFQGLNQLAAILQLLFNAFVFVTWRSGFIHSTGLRKFVTFFGMVIPVAMATVTIVQVFFGIRLLP